MKGILKVFFYLIVPLLGAYAFLVISPQQLPKAVAAATFTTRVRDTFLFAFFEIGFSNTLLKSPTEIYQQNLGLPQYGPISTFIAAFVIFCGASLMVNSFLTDYLPQWQLWHWPLTILWMLLVGAVLFKVHILANRHH